MGATEESNSESAGEEAALREAIESHPEDASAHRALGMWLSQHGRFVEAEGVDRRVIELTPEESIAHDDLGIDLLKQERYEEAAAAFRRSAQLSPESTRAYKFLGRCLEALQRPQEAEAAYREWVRLAPKDVEAHRSLSSTLFDLERFSEAASEARQAIKLNKKDVRSHLVLGGVLLSQERFSDAAYTARKVIKLDSKNPLGHQCLSLALEGQKQPRRAEQVLQEGLKALPGDPVLLQALADLHERNRNTTTDGSGQSDAAELRPSKERPVTAATQAQEEETDLRIRAYLGIWLRVLGLAMLVSSSVALLLLIPHWWSYSTGIETLTRSAFSATDKTAWTIVVASVLSLFVGLQLLARAPSQGAGGWTTFASFCGFVSLIVVMTAAKPSPAVTFANTKISAGPRLPVYLELLCMAFLTIGGLAAFVSLGIASESAKEALRTGVAPFPPLSAVRSPKKRCPDCAEEIQAAARVCRYCGHRFG